jgi:glycosyltransferase involved in cell wall biosynthesis
MRVGWFAHRDPLHPRAGGAERTMGELCTRLSGLGHQMSIVSAAWRGAPSRQAIGEVEILRQPTSFGPHLAVPRFLGRGSHFDAVVMDLAHVVPWPETALLAVPRIAYFRHLHRRTLAGQVRPAYRRLLAFLESSYPLLNGRSTYVTESAQSVRDLVQLGVPQGAIRRIPPGVDLSFFGPGEKSRGAQLIYFAGFRDYKRPLESVKVLEALQHRGIEATLAAIGSGPALPEFKAAVRARGLTDSVRVLGRVPDEELVRNLRSSWINLHFSEAEGWGLSILEASACGVPTVAYRAPGVTETLQDGINGFTVAPDDLEGAVDRIVECVADMDRLARSSREWAGRFTWESCAARWDVLLRELSERGAASVGPTVPRLT